jgi:hypothetical protein
MKDPWQVTSAIALVPIRAAKPAVIRVFFMSLSLVDVRHILN